MAPNCRSWPLIPLAPGICKHQVPYEIFPRPHLCPANAHSFLKDPLCLQIQYSKGLIRQRSQQVSRRRELHILKFHTARQSSYQRK